MKNERKNILIWILIIIILLLMGLCVYLLFIKKDDSINNGENKSVVNTFTSTYPEEGIATVTGYANIVEALDCGDGPCDGTEPKVQYVSFNIVNTESEGLIKYIDEMSGNSFVGSRSIGLGCVDNGKISYNNSSDEFGMKGFTIDNSLSSKILSSTKEEPITLELEKLKLSYGSGAPVCYSHMTYVREVK